MSSGLFKESRQKQISFKTLVNGQLNCLKWVFVAALVDPLDVETDLDVEKYDAKLH